MSVPSGTNFLRVGHSLKVWIDLTMEESKGFEPLWHPNIFLKNITFVQLGQLSKMQKEQYNI